MENVVLDACVLGNMLVNEPKQDYSIKVLDLIGTQQVQVIVPQLFYDEILNLLLKTLYHKNITNSEFSFAIETLLIFYSIFNNQPVTYSAEIIQRRAALALKHNLRSYDAIYLDLALTQHCKLATLDQRLSRAAQTKNCFFQA